MNSFDSPIREARKPEAHFRFKPDGPFYGNGMFKVLGLCWDAEKGKQDKEPVVIFSPIEEPSGPLPVADVLLRISFSKFFDAVEWMSEEIPRFVRVRDPEVYEELEKIRDKMCVEIKLVSPDHSDTQAAP